jgi:glycogen operon protein
MSQIKAAPDFMSMENPINPPALQAGQPWPLGATFDGQGINFAVFSAHAQAIDLCLFDAGGSAEIARYRLPAHTSDVWHGYLPDARPGLIYGLRAHGPWQPERGHRFNAAKLLLDPYARELVGTFDWRDEHFGFDRKHPLRPDIHDNSAFALKARVTYDEFDWGDDSAPHTPLARTVLYEMHIKGFSRLNANIPEPQRGTFAGLAHESSIAHLQRLGITAVSILPAHFAISEERLVKLGLRNYWSYNTLAFFCINPGLSSRHSGREDRDEFRTMVRALHHAGIEVLLDVVYNHTAESDETGPTLSFRGLDNACYYRLPPESRTQYENYSGCGNTLDIRHPRVLQMVMDSLRYWVNEMHVDGFRFDLAPVLGRDDHGFNRDGAFFTAVAQDPVLSKVKMIAEPWDIGPGGYQTRGFPRGWLEWNDRFRDAMRSFWLGADHSGHTRGDFAMRLCASSDLYQTRQRTPAESVNYVVSHDGFTLRDLVSYNGRHNQANGEGNRDGHEHNLSSNCGVEGPTDAPEVQALRGRLQRALLASTLLAQGTPMLCAGDELGHTQDGNNNPYCQDNGTSWIDWTEADGELTAFTERVISLRHLTLPFANQWYSGVADAQGRHDLWWLNSDGTELRGDSWHDPVQRVLGCLIGKPGRSKVSLLLLVNASASAESFQLPPGAWDVLLDSTHPRGFSEWRSDAGSACPLPAQALLLLQSDQARLV